jgi:hypothetical protein
VIHQKNLIAPPFLLAEAAQLLVKSSLSPFLTPNCRNRHLRFLVAVGQTRNHQRNTWRLSLIRTGQNPESACGMWGQVAHLDHERDMEKGLDQPGR